MADQTSKHASNTAGQQRKAVNVQRARLRTIQRVSVLAATGLLVAAEKEVA